MLNTGIHLPPVSMLCAGWSKENENKGRVIPDNLRSQTGDATLVSVYKSTKLQLLYFPVTTQPSVHTCVPFSVGRIKTVSQLKLTYPFDLTWPLWDVYLVKHGFQPSVSHSYLLSSANFQVSGLEKVSASWH